MEVEAAELFPELKPTVEVEPAIEPDLRPVGEPAPSVEIRTSTRRRKTVAAHWEGDAIVVVVPHRLPKRDRQAYADELAAKLIASRARTRPTDESLTERARALSRRYLDGRARPAAVTWSSQQRSRWGSCSVADRTIRVSDRLKDVPGWVLDTVLLHELCHLIHPDHSPAFHELAGRHPRMADSDVFLAGYALGLERAAASASNRTPSSDSPGCSVP